jgi:uncharacterized SAM-dependent methyltransferase
VKFFKNTELAKTYNVSEKAVRNWVSAAKSGKLDLQLYEKDGKFYVANITRNIPAIEQLVQKGQKYKNSRGHKVVAPTSKFYEIYNSQQIFEIVSSLNVHRELPMQYNYLLQGADDWDSYANRLAEEDTPNMLNVCRQLLETSFDSLDRYIGTHRRVNIIDIGIGNCMPVKGLLGHLIKTGRLNRYMGLDISSTMLDIAKSNLNTWFKDSSKKFEFYERDISHEEFGDLIAHDYFGQGNDTPINLVLFLGGTIANFEVPDDILRIIHRSMQPDDLFILSLKLDTPNSRQYFDLDPDPTKPPQKIASWHRLVLDLLNIDESLYDVEQAYDDKRKERFIGAKLKVDVSIKFKISNGEHVIDLHKGECLQVLRYRHQNASDVMRLIDRSGFDVLHTTQSRDHEYFLVMSELRKNLS